jgi:hypothetical protein
MVSKSTSYSDAQIIELWLGRQASPLTRDCYQRDVDRLLSHTRKPLCQIALGDLQGFAQSLVAVGLAPVSRARTVPGAKGYDSSAYTRVDAHTIKSRYLNAGNVLQTATWTVSQDGKTLTYRSTGVDANGRQVNELRIYEKQQ